VTRVGLETATKLVKQVLLETEVGAKVLASGGTYSKGRLADSIHITGPIVVGPTVRGSVSSDLPYAKIVHDGAKIHAIFPKGVQGYRFGSRRRPQLKFFWRRAGRVVYMPQVPGSRNTVGRSHPGLKGKKYLIDPLRASARRHGFKVLIFDV
jgi:hypothetical protein